MTTKFFILFLLIVSLAFGGGYLVARHNAAPGNVAPAPIASASANSQSHPNLPAIRQKKSATDAAPRPKVSSKPSLEEIEAKIREMGVGGMNYGNRRRYTDWQKFVDSIDPADMPQALAFLETTSSKNVRDSLRGALLGKWAETDLHSDRKSVV